MTSNEAYLLRKMVEQQQAELAPGLTVKEYFNWFVADHVQKIYDPSTDDIKAGLVDGPDHGAIDGFYVLVGGSFVSEDPSFKESSQFLPKGLTIDVIIFQAKLTESFSEKPLDSMQYTLRQLLRSVGRWGISGPYTTSGFLTRLDGSVKRPNS